MRQVVHAELSFETVFCRALWGAHDTWISNRRLDQILEAETDSLPALLIRTFNLSALVRKIRAASLTESSESRSIGIVSSLPLPVLDFLISSTTVFAFTASRAVK